MDDKVLLYDTSPIFEELLKKNKLLEEKNRLLEEKNRLFLMNISGLLLEMTAISNNRIKNHKNICLTDKYGLGKVFDFYTIYNNKYIKNKLVWISFDNIILLRSYYYYLTKDNISINNNYIPYGTTNLRWREDYKSWSVDIIEN